MFCTNVKTVGLSLVKRTNGLFGRVLSYLGIKKGISLTQFIVIYNVKVNEVKMF